MKKNKKGCDLETCMLCKRCLPEWIPAVGAERKNFSVKKGELLFREGDPVTGIYFVNSGAVKVHKHWTEGKELIVRFARKGDIVGHRGIGKNNLFPVSATALEPSELCYVSLDFFFTSLRVNRELLFDLMLFYAGELNESEQNMRNMVHLPVKGRVVQALLTLQEKFGTAPNGSLDFSISRQDLASFAGTTYETVFRILGELAEERLISVSGRDIFIPEPEKLRALTREKKV